MIAAGEATGLKLLSSIVAKPNVLTILCALNRYASAVHESSASTTYEQSKEIL